MDASVKLLKETVEHYSPSGEEKKVAHFLVDYMKKLGFNSFVDEVNNAVGISGNGKKTILLLGHIDTVPGFITPRIKHGKLFGRGSVDAKGCFCTFIEATKLSKSNAKIILVGAVEEENASSKGARHILDKYKPDYIIIGEPSSYDALTLGYKGRLLIDFSLEMKNSHTASSDSPIDSAINFYNTLKEYTDKRNIEKTIFDTIQMTARDVKYSSDGFSNRVYMKIGCRMPLDFSFEDFEPFINKAKGDGKIKFYGQEHAVKAKKNNKLVSRFLNIMRKHGIQAKFKVKTGTSDMNILHNKFPDTPILAYGPGDSSLDHTPNEHIVINEYKKAIQILSDVLSTF